MPIPNVTRFVRSGKIGDNAANACVVSNVLDFSQLNVAANDVVGALKIDPGTVVLAVGVKCITPQGAAATVKIGDQSAADKYLGATDANTDATDAGAPVANPVYYKAEDTITVTPSAALTKAKLYVWAVIAKVINQ